MAGNDPLRSSVSKHQRLTETPGARLQKKLGWTFLDPDLLQQALAHPSTGDGGAYERLEFLGDRVLGLAVADLLLACFPEESEGDLARRHAALVRREALAGVARSLDLGAALTLGRGEAEGGGRDNPANLADALESVLGALYLEAGYPAAAKIIHRLWQELVSADPAPPRDAKSALQEWTQGRGLGLPIYETIEASGPDHAPFFTVAVSIGDDRQGRGEGLSKRLAEQNAAADLLARLGEGGRR